MMEGNDAPAELPDHIILAWAPPGNLLHAVQQKHGPGASSLMPRRVALKRAQDDRDGGNEGMVFQVCRVPMVVLAAIAKGEVKHLRILPAHEYGQEN